MASSRSRGPRRQARRLKRFLKFSLRPRLTPGRPSPRSTSPCFAPAVTGLGRLQPARPPGSLTARSAAGRPGPTTSVSPSTATPDLRTKTQALCSSQATAATLTPVPFNTSMVEAGATPGHGRRPLTFGLQRRAAPRAARTYTSTDMPVLTALSSSTRPSRSTPGRPSSPAA